MNINVPYTVMAVTVKKGSDIFIYVIFHIQFLFSLEETSFVFSLIFFSLKILFSFLF